VSSKAAKRFFKSARDVKRLIEIHTELGGNTRGRKYDLEVLNKSAIVLVTAIWEAYCEDLAEESLTHVIDRVRHASNLPNELKKQIADEIKSDKHELAVWDLADKGWRDRAKARFRNLVAGRLQSFNNPKSHAVDELFYKTIGLKDVSSGWHWRKMTAKSACDKLDRFIVLRGSIAHRGQLSSGGVRKAQVREYYSHVVRLVQKTGPQVYSFCKKVTGRKPW
jgi:hypothetical protein